MNVSLPHGPAAKVSANSGTIGIVTSVWPLLLTVRTVISPLVASELGRLKEPHRSSYLKLIANLEQVDLTEEAAILAEGYIARGIFHRKYIADALHVAIASFHKIDYLVTWNFGHLANVRRQARIRLFNTAAGFYVPMIVTPEFLVSEATEQVT